MSSSLPSATFAISPRPPPKYPPQYKGESWARMGVNTEDGFKPLYVIPAKKKQQVTKLKNLLKNATALYLATDEDREGEAIAWHLIEVLKPKVPVKRMVFGEITRTAIRNAIENPRDVDSRLVDAQEARRILDRLYGYEVSPVLWGKVAPKLSAGRVQSVATRLAVDRERARRRFVSADYWDMDAVLQVPADGARTFTARLVELTGKRVAIGKDFNPETGKLAAPAGLVLLNEKTARSVASQLGSADFTVTDVAQKPFTQRAHPPFITSTLQQEAARKLRFSARRTMGIAQNLYENGFITYMRTDSTNLSTQAINAARNQVTDLYGSEFLPETPRSYTRKSKNAQEAHEAIRPAGEAFRTPDSVKGELDSDAFHVYDLIWKRTIASQMKDAAGYRTNVRISAPAGQHGTAVFAASGKVITFPGFLRAYVQASDDPEAELEDQERVLPPLSEDQQLKPLEVEPKGHTTQPPPRYTEASLIKELEERGIGRPSTYAAIIATIQERGYVWKKGTALVPTLPAFAVVNLLEQHFTDLVDYDFTARMEDDLDNIANGQCRPTPWLNDFYFGKPNAKKNNGHNVAVVGLKRLIGSGWKEIDARQICSLPIGKDQQGRTVVARVGRYGPYLQIEDTDLRATLPDDIPLDELSLQVAIELLDRSAQGDRAIGQDPQTQKPVYLKNGRFGPYVQLGDPELTEKGNRKRGSKPKMASLWPDMSIETITLEQALLLLSFPRTLGVHPETGKEITVQDGRYGPYLKMESETRSLDDHQHLTSVTLEEAVAIFAQPKTRRRAAKASLLAEIGQHPASGAALQVLSGRFGPYVTDGVVNASLRKGHQPEKLTIEQAVELLEAREQRMREQGKDPRAKKTARKSTAKKKSTRKTPAKKTAKKKTKKKTQKKSAARTT